jgi:GATA-binding protein
MEMEEDSPMDFIHHPTQSGATTSVNTGNGSGQTATTTTVMQDDELFSAYLNHHPTPPPSEGVEVDV